MMSGRRGKEEGVGGNARHIVFVFFSLKEWRDDG